MFWLLVAVSCLIAPPALAVFGDEDDSGQAPILCEIIIEGNTETSTSLIRQEMDVQIGDHLDLDQVDVIWDHLMDLEYFAYVDVDYDDTDPTCSILSVIVEEDKTTNYSPYIRYDRRHKYLLGAWIQDSNLRGKGERLKIEAVGYRIQRLRAGWQHPWLFGQRGLCVALEVQGEGGPFVYRPLHYQQWSGRMSLRWEGQEPFFCAGSAGYTHFDQRHEYTWQQPYRGTITPPGTATYPAAKRRALVFSAAVGIDSRNNPYYPASGLFDQLQVCRYQSDDFVSFTELTADARIFFPTPWDHIIALRGWGRRVDGPLPIEHCLYFGGPQSVRGTAWASREGEEGYLLSLEYRLPLFLMPISPNGELVGVGLHLFTDAGDSWFDGDEAGRAMQSWGAGIHLNLSTNQFRFEVARTEDDETSFEFFDVFNF